MSATRVAHPHQLRLLEPAAPHLVSALTRPAERGGIEALTQQLVDALIEILDLVDGDPNAESNGDEFEDEDGL